MSKSSMFWVNPHNGAISKERSSDPPKNLSSLRTTEKEEDSRVRSDRKNGDPKALRSGAHPSLRRPN
jgi:hypothetical protein